MEIWDSSLSSITVPCHAMPCGANTEEKPGGRKIFGLWTRVKQIVTNKFSGVVVVEQQQLWEMLEKLIVWKISVTRYVYSTACAARSHNGKEISGSWSAFKILSSCRTLCLKNRGYESLRNEASFEEQSSQISIETSWNEAILGFLTSCLYLSKKICLCPSEQKFL